jgi:hypothetical protein
MARSHTFFSQTKGIKRTQSIAWLNYPNAIDRPLRIKFDHLDLEASPMQGHCCGQTGNTPADY